MNRLIFTSILAICFSLVLTFITWHVFRRLIWHLLWRLLMWLEVTYWRLTMFEGQHVFCIFLMCRNVTTQLAPLCTSGLLLSPRQRHRERHMTATHSEKSSNKNNVKRNVKRCTMWNDVKRYTDVHSKEINLHGSHRCNYLPILSTCPITSTYPIYFIPFANSPVHFYSSYLTFTDYLIESSSIQWIQLNSYICCSICLSIKSLSIYVCVHNFMLCCDAKLCN